METTAMSTFLETVGTVLTSAVGWVGVVIDTITAQPILLVYAAIPLVGLGVGLYERLISAN